MPVATIQTNFTAGEISPRLGGRVDLAKYDNGLEVLRNMYAHPHGGAARRSGFRFIREVLGRQRIEGPDFSAPGAWDAGAGWSLDAEGALRQSGQGASSDLKQEEVLVNGRFHEVRIEVAAVDSGRVRPEMGAGCFGEWIEAPGTHVLKLEANGADAHFRLQAEAGFAGRISRIEIREIGPKARLVPFQFSTEQAYVLELSDKNMRVYKDGGVVLDGDDPVEVQTPWTEDELCGIKYAQSADVMYLTHPNREVMKLSRAGHADWTLESPQFIGPFEAENSTETTVRVSNPSIGQGRIMYSSASLFQAGDVGRQITARPAGTGEYKCGAALITGVTSQTEAEVEVLQEFNDTAATKVWAWSAWSEASGRPSGVTFFEERLCFSRGQTIWMSRSADYENFSVSAPLLDSDACCYTISSDQVNVIRWLVSHKLLLIGTVGGEWRLSGGSGSDAVTPSSVLVRRETTHGSADIQPITAGGAVFFVQRDGKKVRVYGYSLETDGYTAPEATILAEHLTRNDRIIGWAYQQSPHGVIWIATAKGRLLSLTFEAEQGVMSFARHDTPGEFESLAVIPGDDGDELWAVVRREVQGLSRRYVERMDPEFSGEEARLGFFLDSGLSFGRELDITGISLSDPARVECPGCDFSPGECVRIESVLGMEELNGRDFTVQDPDADGFELAGEDSSDYGEYVSGGLACKLTDELYGLDHLEGEEVEVLADGAPQRPKTVREGRIGLDRPARTVHAGLGFVSDMRTLRLDLSPPSGSGTSQGRTKRVSRVTLRLHQSLGLKIGPDEDRLESAPFRHVSDRMGRQLPLFSGDYSRSFNAGYDSDGRIHIRQDQPLPLCVLAVIPEVGVYGA